MSSIFRLPVNFFRFRFCSTFTSEGIVVDKVGQVTTIGLNRPDKRNCINATVAKLLEDALLNFENDDSSYVAVLHGTGGNFCAGYDLSELSKMDNMATNLSEKGPIGLPFRITKKPLVAAISGYAVAGGLELAMMCDLRVMEENAILGVYNRRFGIPLINGGTVRLQAIVGLSRALDLILTGRSLDAKEAFEWGLANRYVACGTALGQAITLASSLVKFPQKCLLQDRESTYNSAFKGAYEELLRYEQTHGREVFNNESIEGAKKFVAGVGRHGKTYNLTEKQISDWEKV